MDKFGLYHIVNEVPALAKRPPSGFIEITDKFLINSISNGFVYQNRINKLIVISSLAEMENGKKYFHVSLYFKDHIPSWDMTKLVKDCFIGENRDAFIYFPKKNEYVNAMPYCLHLWSEEN